MVYPLTKNGTLLRRKVTAVNGNELIDLTTLFQIALYITPFFGTFLTTAFEVIRDKPIPPILPQINGFSLSTAFVALATGVVVGQEINREQFILGILLLLALFAIQVAHAAIQRGQERITRKHIEDKLEEITLKTDVNRKIVTEIATEYIDVDFIVTFSLTNRIWGVRQRRREQFATLIQGLAISQKTSKGESIDQELFIVPSEKRIALNLFYTAIAILSVVSYVASIRLLITFSVP